MSAAQVDNLDALLERAEELIHQETLHLRSRSTQMFLEVVSSLGDVLKAIGIEVAMLTPEDGKRADIEQRLVRLKEKREGNLEATRMLTKSIRSELDDVRTASRRVGKIRSANQATFVASNGSGSTRWA